MALLIPATSAGRQLNDLRRETPLLTPAQIHAQQHLRPVLGFCATGTRLNLQIGVSAIRLALKHAMELQRCQAGFKGIQFGVYVLEGVPVLVSRGQLGQFAEVRQVVAQLGQNFDHMLEARSFPVQITSAALILPHLRVGKLQLYLFKALRLAIVVKGTP